MSRFVAPIRRVDTAKGHYYSVRQRVETEAACGRAASVRTTEVAG